MATIYHLNDVASDLSVPGANWDNEMLDTALSPSVQASSIAANSAETDYGFSIAGKPESTIIPGGDFTILAEISTGSAQVTLDMQLARVNSSGVVQSGPVASDGGSQVATAGQKIFLFTAPALGSWSAGDRLRVQWDWFNNQCGGPDNVIIQDVGATGTQTVAPWTFLDPTGLAPTVVLGTPVLGIAHGGHAPTVALGSHMVDQDLDATGLAPTVALGTHALLQGLSATGLAPTAAFGAHSVSLLNCPGIPPTLVLGTPVLGIHPAGVAPTAVFGSHGLFVPVPAVGLAPTVALGSHNIRDLGAVGLAPTVVFGSHVAAVMLAALGLGPTVQFGVIGNNLTPPRERAFGKGLVTQRISP